MTNAENNTPENTRQGVGLNDENKISIYPNPTTDMLNVDFNATSLVNTVVKISDMRGRIVKQIQARSEKGMNNMTVSLHELTSGVYNIQIFQDSKLVMADKITKQD